MNRLSLLLLPAVLLQVSGRNFHVLLTSYELLMGAQDRPRLSRVKWHGIVVDEGHRYGHAACGPAALAARQ